MQTSPGKPAAGLTYSSFPVQIMLDAESGRCALEARASVIPESWLFTSEQQAPTPAAAQPLPDSTTASHPQDLRIADRPKWVYRSNDANGTGGFLLRDSLDRIELSITTESTITRLGRQAVTTGHALLLPVTEMFYPLGSKSELTEAQIGVDGVLTEATPSATPNTSLTLGVFPGLAHQPGDGSLPQSIRILLGLRHYRQRSDLSLFAMAEPTAIWITGGIGWGWEIFTLSADALIWAPDNDRDTASSLRWVDLRSRSTWGVTAAPSGDTALRIEWAWNDPRLRRSVFPGQTREGIVPPSQFRWIDQHLSAARFTWLMSAQYQVHYSLVYRPKPPPETATDPPANPTREARGRISDLLFHGVSLTWDIDDRSTFQASIGQERADNLKRVSAWTGRLSLASTY